MQLADDEARVKRRQDRIGGTILIVGAIVMVPVSISMSVAIPIPGRAGAKILYGGLAVWAVMAILGIVMVRRGAEKRTDADLQRDNAED